MRKPRLEWQQNEIEFVVHMMVDKNLSLSETVVELNKLHPEWPRTINGALSALKTREIKISDLRAQKYAVRIIEDINPDVPETCAPAKIRTESIAGTPVEEVEKEEEPGELSEKNEAVIRKLLSERGYRVEKLSPDKMDRKFIIDPSMFEGELYRFGVVSCTHLGSMYQQLTYLKNFYQLCQDRGIKAMFHCGDLVDGVKVYGGHEYELFLHGERAQGDYAIEHYPKMENGGKTYVIAGNHDYSFMKEAGADILKRVSEQRLDIEYLGAFGAYPLIGPVKIYLQHGARGGAYARSYRLQKNIEQFAPEAKPDFYFLGHYHTGCYLPEYRNVFSALVPCFQSQTPFERRLGLYPEVAGMIIEFTVNDRFRKSGIVGMKLEWIPFYVPVEKDY